MTASIKAQDLPSLVGEELEPSDWFEITQAQVNQFADATHDHQFIHVKPLRAKFTPFHGTIAHGFLVLSMISHLAQQKAQAVAAELRKSATVEYVDQSLEPR